MRKKITNYLHTEDGDIEKVRFTERFCGCSGKCYPDTLELEDYKSDEYLSLKIDSPEIAFFVKELLDKSCERVIIIQGKGEIHQVAIKGEIV